MDDTFVCLGRASLQEDGAFPTARAQQKRVSLRARKKLDRVRQIFSDQSASPFFRNKNIVATLQRARTRAKSSSRRREERRDRVSYFSRLISLERADAGR